MPTNTVSAGGQTTLSPTVAYSLPPKAVYVQSVAAVEVSVNGSTWGTLTGSTTGSVITAAAFIRAASTTQSTIVSVKSV